MTDKKPSEPAPPKAGAARAEAIESTLPVRSKAVPAEELGLKTEEAKVGDDEPKFEVYEPKAGWVQDRDGRHHEVEDTALYLQAYPGSKALKQGEVEKSKVGYAAPEQSEA